jgi:elongation factor 1 alpha-like protein
VAQRDIDKYKKQAAQLNKSSFALAWVMDTGTEERERGVTVDIAQHPFHTEHMDFTILDAPGHRDFVPNMLAGASMADLAVLVVDANQLESGMKGQTREHILLAKACGIKRVVVVVNKLDSTAPQAWDEGVFNHVRQEIGKFLEHSGFEKDSVSFVPVSGLSGANVVKPPPKTGDTAWVTGASSTLLQELERSPPTGPSEDEVEAPLRMQIADVFRGSITNPLSVSGRIVVGAVQVGDTVLIQPSGEKAGIRGIESSGEGKDWAVAGEMCTLHLTDIDPIHLRTGDVLCSAERSVSVIKTFIARVDALEALLPQGVDVHLGRLHVPGKVAALISIIDTKGEVVKKKPRVVKAGEVAHVKISLDSGAPLAVGDRVVLRSTGNTMASGRIERVAS